IRIPCCNLDPSEKYAINLPAPPCLGEALRRGDLARNNPTPSYSSVGCFYLEIHLHSVRKKAYEPVARQRNRGTSMKPWKLSLLLLAGSLAVTVLLWYLGLPFFFVFLFVPLAPLFGRRRTVRTCPLCGWETTGSERFCPRDATPLQDPGGEGGEGEK